MKSSLVRIRHARSKKDFPFLSLEEGEYVELLITCSRIGLIMIWTVAILALVILGVIATAVIGAITRSTTVNQDAMTYFWMLHISVSLFIILIGLGASRRYLGNKLFITNKRIFHYKTDTLLQKSVSIIELSRIEEVSFKQKTILDHLFSLGTIHMSTVGDETSYTFPYVDTPKDEIELIAHLVHGQKTKA